jgi:signal transduction histidine kinase
MYQAESKNIKLSCKFVGFPAKAQYADQYAPYTKNIPVEHQNLIIDSDEKRIKQVLINLQSNALKFTKENGSITITVEFIRGKYPGEKYIKRAKSKDSYAQSSDSHNSDESKFEREHRFEDIYAPAT